MPFEKNVDKLKHIASRGGETIRNGELVRRIGAVIGITAASACLLTACNSEQEETQILSVGDTIESAAQKVGVSAEAKVKAAARCDRQTQKDPRSYNSCQYIGAYAAMNSKNPDWVIKHHLDIPGKDDKNDRKKLFYKTHPAVRKLVILENEAGVNYQSPNATLWNKVNDNECSDTWDCDTGNGYFGGLQMDMGFQATYNRQALKLWGVASNWPKNSQMLAADRAYNGYNGYAARGLGPWPSSNAEFGTFPVPVRKIS